MNMTHRSGPFRSNARLPAARPRRGFTLIELLLVITLIGVMAMMVAPRLIGLERHYALEESVARSKALIAMCRAEAMNDAKRYRIEFRRNGSLSVTAQKDALTAPNEYVPIAAPWANLPVLQEDVWVASIIVMEDGPPPILVDDESISFTKSEAEPLAVEELDEPLRIEFLPDGASPSLTWVLRDSRGHGRQMTLDGRLGRLAVTELEPLKPEEITDPRKTDAN